MILYTMQSLERDITRHDEPTADYKDGGPYFPIVEYLEWDHWLWCFPSLEDFENDWLSWCAEKYQLWTLDIPEKEIRWCALDRYCENELPVECWFSDCPEIIREWRDIPQALILCPVKDSQVVFLQDGHMLRYYLEGS